MLTTRTYRGGKEGGTGCGVAAHVKTGEYVEVTTHDDVERIWVPRADVYSFHRTVDITAFGATNVSILTYGSVNFSPPLPAPPPPPPPSWNINVRL